MKHGRKLKRSLVATTGVTALTLILAVAWVVPAESQANQRLDPGWPREWGLSESQVDGRLGQRWLKELGGIPPASETPRQPQAAQRTPITGSGAWRRATSPQGRFSVELPEGWEIKIKDPQEIVVTFGPAGRDFPGVTIVGWIEAALLHSMLTQRYESDPRLICRQVSAQDFYTQIFLPFLRQQARDAVQDLKIERVSPSQPGARARVEGSLTYQGKVYRVLDMVSMEYMPDPTLSLIYGCPQPVYSLAFIGGFGASSDEFPALLPVAERILGSFSPNAGWGAELRQILIGGIQYRMAMIGRTVNNVARMEMDQQMREIQSSRRINQGWIDTMGGVYRWKDPTDPSRQGTISGSQIPSGPTRWWYCVGSKQPVPSDRSPGYGCREGAAPY